jgi:hypothetical protein
MRRLLALPALMVALAALPAGASGAPGDPLFPPFVPTALDETKVPPTGYFIGPCGLGVDSTGRFYVSDYYHHTVDLFAPSTKYEGQLKGVDPLDGPCGLALDSTNRLYVNSFDRGVLRFGAAPTFGTGVAIAGAGVDDNHPTGVAVDPTTDNVYINSRTYITAYDPSGAQLMDGPNPLQIGLGSLGEGYGLAIDGAGRLYVADAVDDTVKVYDPATSLTTPTKTIAGPPGGFTSLRHAALAVDRISGVLYVIDNLQPHGAEAPRAQVEVFNPGAISPYLGVLKYQIVDALPAGLAVDNSAGLTQGRVYVTSGNTNQAGIYAYAPGSQIAGSQPPLTSVTVKTAGAGVVRSDLGELQCSAECTTQIRAGAEVTLTATPDPGSIFGGWSGGDCSGVGECTLAMDQARSVSADFEALSSAPVFSPAAPAPPSTAAIGTAAPLSAAQRRHHRTRRHQRAVRRASISAKRAEKSR